MNQSAREFVTGELDAGTLRNILKSHGLAFEECRPFPWTHKVFIAVGALAALESAAQEIERLTHEMWWNRQW